MSYSLIYNLIDTRFVHNSKDKWTNTHTFTIWKHDINLESQTFCSFMNMPLWIWVLECPCWHKRLWAKWSSRCWLYLVTFYNVPSKFFLTSNFSPKSHRLTYILYPTLSKPFSVTISYSRLLQELSHKDLGLIFSALSWLCDCGQVYLTFKALVCFLSINWGNSWSQIVLRIKGSVMCKILGTVPGTQTELMDC